jgi:hypothetical protein
MSELLGFDMPGLGETPQATAALPFEETGNGRQETGDTGDTDRADAGKAGERAARPEEDVIH